MEKIEITPDTSITELMHAVDDSAIDEVLFHHGIKGMKWGVRRTPEQLGHKPASKKARKKAKTIVERLRARSQAKKSAKEEKKREEEQHKKELEARNKPVSKMTDSELREHLNRVRMEREAYVIDRDIKTLNPEKTSSGKKFISEFGDKAVKPAAMDAGRKLMTKLMDKAVDKALGDAKDPMLALKKEAEKAGYMQAISNAKNAAEKAKYQEHITKKTIDDYNRERNESARQANEERSRQEYERTGGTYSYKPKSSSDKVYVGEVVDTRKGQSYVSGYLSKPASSVSNNNTIALGQTYIAGYLPAPKDDD